MHSPQLPKELARIWGRQLKPLDWQGRLLLINDFHENLQEMIPDMNEFCEVFPATVMETLNLISETDITCDMQAHVFANSSDQKHRQAAGAWFRSHSGNR